MASVASYADQARARKMAEANAVGIDDALISRLVETFYVRVRDDDLLVARVRSARMIAPVSSTRQPLDSNVPISMPR